MEELIRDAIKSILAKNKKIVIYPFGFWGKRAKEILNEEFGIQEFCISDNNCAEGNVKRIADLDADKMNDYCYLIACIADEAFTEIIKSLDELNVDDENLIDVFWNFHYYHLNAPVFMIYDAQRHGLTLAQYYENHYNRLGVKSDTAMNNISSIIDIPEGGSICEIGSGSGRFMVKLIEKFKPAKYEFYEIEKKLAEYIVQNYKYSYCQIIDREANGRDLEKTADESQDLVFVSNVFPLIKYSDTYRYFLEMIRVCKVGGYVVFDAHTEDTLLESVLSDENNYANEWRILPNNVIENIFEQRNMKLVSKFKNHMAGGKMDTPLFNIVESWFVYKKV